METRNTETTETKTKETDMNLNSITKKIAYVKKFNNVGTVKGKYMNDKTRQWILDMMPSTIALCGSVSEAAIELSHDSNLRVSAGAIERVYNEDQDAD